MCYFIIGNLHRLKAELKDRGLIRRTSSTPTSQQLGSGGASSSTSTVTVATVVRALQVAASCPYPTHELAKLVAKAVRLHRSLALAQQKKALASLLLAEEEEEEEEEKAAAVVAAARHEGKHPGAASKKAQRQLAEQQERQQLARRLDAVEEALRRADAGDGLEVWDVPVDILLLEEQLDNYLMEI